MKAENLNAAVFLVDFSEYVLKLFFLTLNQEVLTLRPRGPSGPMSPGGPARP